MIFLAFPDSTIASLTCGEETRDNQRKKSEVSICNVPTRTEPNTSICNVPKRTEPNSKNKANGANRVFRFFVYHVILAERFQLGGENIEVAAIQDLSGQSQKWPGRIAPTRKEIRVTDHA
jgi:hypothetical protein